MKQIQDPGEIIQPNNREPHKWIYAAIVLYLTGITIFLTHAWFDDNWRWDKAYYLWDKSKDLILFISLSAAYKPLRGILKFIIAFSYIRLLWEIITAGFIVSQNDQKVVAILWLILVFFIVILSLKETLNEWKKYF